MIDSLIAFSPGEFVPLVGIIAPFAFVIFIVGFGMLQTAHQKKLQHETIRHALDKGQPVPAELLGSEQSKAESPSNDRKAGIVLLSVAAGLFVTCNALSSTFSGLDIHLGALITRALSWLACIPAFIGAGLLLNWWLDQKSKAAKKSPEQV